MAVSQAYRHTSIDEVGRDFPLKISFEDSFLWLVIKNVDLVHGDDHEAVLLLEKLGKVKITVLKVLRLKRPMTLFAKYESSDAKNTDKKILKIIQVWN